MALSSSSRIFVLTGATDGIGRHTAQKLAADGHALIVHGRRPEAGEELVKDLMARGASSCHYINKDLANLEQVEELAIEVHKLTDHVDVLINNAGVFDPEPRTSVQGYEMTWAVNVMAPFLLTRRLLDLLEKSPDEKDVPRIITTSSISQSGSVSNFPSLFEKGESNGYSAHGAYSRSKWGDYMLTAKLARILNSNSNPNYQRIKCLTMDPGTVNTKMLLAGWGACGINVKKADNTYSLAATSYGGKQKSGSYHFGGGGSKDARDDSKLTQLWELLEEHTGCTYSDL